MKVLDLSFDLLFRKCLVLNINDGLIHIKIYEIPLQPSRYLSGTPFGANLFV